MTGNNTGVRYALITVLAVGGILTLLHLAPHAAGHECILLIKHGSIYRIEPDGTGVRQLKQGDGFFTLLTANASGDRVAAIRAHTYPKPDTIVLMNADGKSIIFTGGEFCEALYTVNTDGTGLKKLFQKIMICRTPPFGRSGCVRSKVRKHILRASVDIDPYASDFMA